MSYNITYYILHHLCSPCPHLLHILEYVGILSVLQLVHHGVNGHVGPCAACSRTAYSKKLSSLKVGRYVK